MSPVLGSWRCSTVTHSYLSHSYQSDSECGQAHSQILFSSGWRMKVWSLDTEPCRYLPTSPKDPLTHSGTPAENSFLRTQFQITQD